jgi:hypothetical protein
MPKHLTFQTHLELLAKKFADTVQDLGDSEGRGWGQFLDAPSRHRQVGLYGTAAGLIVLSLAGHSQGVAARRTAETIAHWWSVRDTDTYAAQRFLQNLRLSFAFLGLRLSNQEAFSEASSEMELALLQRCLPSGGWGNWWVNEENHDDTPRVFTTSVALIALNVFRVAPEDPAKRLSQAQAWLTERAATTVGLTRLERAAALTALLWAPIPLSRPTAKTLYREARTSDWSLSEKDAYFFTYEMPEHGDDHVYPRDYFLAPPAIVRALGGFSDAAPARLLLRAEELADTLGNNISANGAFRFAEGEYLSSIDQAWAALLLSAALRRSESAFLLQRIAYVLLRHRKENWATIWLYPLSCLAAVACFQQLTLGLSTTAQFFLSTACYIIAGLSADRLLRHLVD